MGFGCKAGVGAVVHSAGSTILGMIGCLGEEPGASAGSSSLPRRLVSSSGLGEGPGSSLVGLSRVASTISSSLRGHQRGHKLL